MTWIATFNNVGRGKVNWTEEFPEEPTDAQLMFSIRRSGALLSRDVDVERYDSGTGGEIVVVGFRTVGRFHVEKKR